MNSSGLRHVMIQNQATKMLRVRLKELGCRSESLRGVTSHIQYEPNRVQHGGVVINNGH